MKDAARGVAPLVRPFVVLILMAPGVRAQDRPLPASPTPPREELERQRAQPPSPPAASPTVDQLLQQLGLTRADIERRKAAPVNLFAASAQEPPEEQERRRIGEPPTPSRSPTFQELIAELRRQSGGSEVLDRARRGGAQIPPAPEADQDALGEFAFAGGFVQGDSPLGVPSREAMQIAVKVTRNAAYALVSGLGTLQGTGSYPVWANNTATWGPFIRNSSTSGATGQFDVKPYMTITLNVLAQGYYLINVVATSTAAELRKQGAGTCCPWALVAGGQWNKSATTGYVSYPVVLNLAAGYHYLYWIPVSSPYEWVHVSEISVTKL